jgi:hypothetical protein
MDGASETTTLRSPFSIGERFGFETATTNLDAGLFAKRSSSGLRFMEILPFCTASNLSGGGKIKDALPCCEKIAKIRQAPAGVTCAIKPILPSVATALKLIVTAGKSFAVSAVDVVLKMHAAEKARHDEIKNRATVSPWKRFLLEPVSVSLLDRSIFSGNLRVP